MTFLYKMFGIPRNIDEAADKAARKKIIPEVYTKRHQGDSPVPRAFPCTYEVGVKVGNTKLTLWKSNEIWVMHYSYMNRPSHPEDSATLKRAYEVADEFSHRGFVVKVNGKFYNLLRG